jgi:hypothetical protein
VLVERLRWLETGCAVARKAPGWRCMAAWIGAWHLMANEDATSKRKPPNLRRRALEEQRQWPCRISCPAGAPPEPIDQVSIRFGHKGRRNTTRPGLRSARLYAQFLEDQSRVRDTSCEIEIRSRLSRNGRAAIPAFFSWLDWSSGTAHPNDASIARSVRHFPVGASWSQNPRFMIRKSSIESRRVLSTKSTHFRRRSDTSC